MIVEIKGIPVSYRDEGAGNTILILHGWHSSSIDWVEIQNNLADRGFRVVMPDLPGAGNTPALLKSWNVDEYIEFIRSFVETLNLSLHGLVGHSFGGRIAVFYAIKYKEDSPSLVLCNAATVFRQRQLRMFVYGLATGFGDFVMKAPTLKNLRPLVQKAFRAITRVRRSYQLTDPIMRDTFKLVINQEMRSHLPQITTPTLILWGKKDHMTPIADAHIMHKEIPTSDLHIFPEAGHVINLQIPNEVAQQISSFLKENSTKNGHIKAP